MSEFFANQYGWAYMIAFPFVVAGLMKLIGLSGDRYAIDVVKLKIPILGSILSKTAIARFTRTLGTLIGRRADPRRDQHHQGDGRQRGVRPGGW